MSKIAKFNFITAGIEYVKGKVYTEDQIKDLDPSNFEDSDEIVAPVEDVAAVEDEIIIAPENEDIDSDESDVEDKKKDLESETGGEGSEDLEDSEDNEEDTLE